MQPTNLSPEQAAIVAKLHPDSLTKCNFVYNPQWEDDPTPEQVASVFGGEVLPVLRRIVQASLRNTNQPHLNTPDDQTKDAPHVA